MPTVEQCVELSKTERSPAKDDKSKKGKGQHRETQYDYTEASLHDGALRAELVLAYESFKVCGFPILRTLVVTNVYSLCRLNMAHSPRQCQFWEKKHSNSS